MNFQSKLYLLYQKYFNVFHLASILLIAITSLWRIHSFSFQMGWDDSVYVLNHYTEDGWFSKNVYSILTEFYRGQYAPVNQLYYSTLFEFFDYNPTYYHIGSIIIHLANCALLYKFIFNISKALFVYTNIKYAQVAFLTTIFFAIAPINLEPIAWVAASKVLLYGTFYLLALIFYLRYIVEKFNKDYYLTLLFFILSFGAKEQAVTLPVCMFLIDYIYKRDFKNSIIWFEKMPMFILSLLFGLASLQSLGAGIKVDGKFYSLIDRLPLVFYTISEYFTKILFPVNLSYIYPFPFQIGQKVPLWLWPYVIIIPLMTYCLFPYLKRKWILFGVSFFLIHILLVSNFINLSRFSCIADRYAYISSIGIYFLIASIIIKANLQGAMKKYCTLVIVIFACFFGVYTNIHSSVWQNSITLKEKLRTTIEMRKDYKSWKIKKAIK